MQILWWYWIVLGCLLCLSELFLPTLILVWLGLAALLTGLLSLLLPMTVVPQLVCWGVLSVLMTLLFLRFFKPRGTDPLAGRSDEILNEVGLITREVAPWSKGEILFQKPVLGADRWACISEQSIAAGERAKVLAVEGSVLRVSTA